MVGLLDFKAAVAEDLVDREPLGGEFGKKRSWDILKG